MNERLPNGVLYIESDKKYSLRKLNSYEWVLYIYFIPILFIIALIFIISHPNYPLWTNNLIFNLLLLGGMIIIYIAAFLIRTRFAHVSKIEVRTNKMTPPFKPFTQWILRKPYNEEVHRINPFQIGISPNIDNGIEVLLSNGKSWYFILSGNRIDGYLEVRPEDNKMISSNIDPEKRKAIKERFNLK